MNMNSSQDKENAELRLLYQISTEDIKYAKSRQWATTYYVLLTFAAIIGFYSLPKSELIFGTWYQKLWLLIPAFGINVLGIYHVMDTQRSLCGYRMRLVAINQEFGARTRGVFDIPAEHEKRYYSYGRYFLSLSLLFMLLMMLGVFFVVCLLLHNKWSVRSSFELVLAVEVISGSIFFCLNWRKVEKAKEKLEKLKESRKTSSS